MHLQTITSLIFLFHLLQLLITACQASSIFFVNIENRFSEFYNSRVLSFLFIASYANCHLVQRTDSPFFFPSLSVSIGYKMEKVNKKRNLDVWVQRVGWLQEFQTGRHIRSSFMVFQSLYTTFQIVCQNFSDETGKWKKPSLLLMFLLRFMYVVKVISLCPSFMVFALFWSFYMLRQSIIFDSIWFLLKIIIIIIITKPKVFIILN
jgi:hypothetical protein